MIVIDGRQSTLEIGNFANLEEVLIKVMEDEVKEDHIVTDVLVNNELFSEIYPHQAEDIDSSELQRVELKTVSMDDMATDVTAELHKVITLMQTSSKSVAVLFRQGDTAEALELLQDLLDVTRHFLGTVHALSGRFCADSAAFSKVSSEMDALLTEMGDVMDVQDWILLSDLLEFEFQPAIENWQGILSGLTDTIAAAKE